MIVLNNDVDVKARASGPQVVRAQVGLHSHRMYQGRVKNNVVFSSRAMHSVSRVRNSKVVSMVQCTESVKCSQAA